MKYCHQIDSNGYYLFSFTPEESPREPGVPLIPAGCVTVDPPSFDKEKQIPKLTEKGWILENLSFKKKSLFRKFMEIFK